MRLYNQSKEVVLLNRPKRSGSPGCDISEDGNL